jgi:dynein heavy chain
MSHLGEWSRNRADAFGLSVILQMSFSLQSSEIVIQPPVSEVNKSLGKVVRSLLESSKAFVRWMDGTCTETPEQKGATEDDEPYVFTFYWDVSQNSEVC